MRLIVLTNPDFYVEEDRVLTALFDEGLDILHLRKPGSEPVCCERLLSLIPDSYHSRIVVHDHFYLVDEFGLMGYHLSPRNPQSPPGQVGARTRTCYSLPELACRKGECRYVLLRNVFDSISEPGSKASFHPGELREARLGGLIDSQVVAEGGITLERLPEVREYGFGGVAVRGDLWRNFDERGDNDFHRLVSHFRKLRKASE